MPPPPRRKPKGKPSLEEINEVTEPQGWRVSRRGMYTALPIMHDKGYRFSFDKKIELLNFLKDDKSTKLVGLDDFIVRETA